VRARNDAAAESFAAFVDAQGQRLLRLAFLLTSGNGAVAEDLLHTVLLRLQERGIADLDEPTTYARRALINEYTTHLRRTERDRRLQARLVAVDARTTASASPEDRLAILAALRELGERERTAIVLRYYEDLADVDIAAVLDCSRSTVRSLIHRAMPKLRRALADPADDTISVRRNDG
jgi:RNA polymerase sigma factor (sigma-70 family)